MQSSAIVETITPRHTSARTVRSRTTARTRRPVRRKCDAYRVAATDTGCVIAPSDTARSKTTQARSAARPHAERSGTGPSAEPATPIVTGAASRESRSGMSRPQTVQAVQRYVREMRAKTGQAEVCFERITRVDPIFVRQCVKTAVDAGATHITISECNAPVDAAAIRAMAHDIAAFIQGDAEISGQRDVHHKITSERSVTIRIDAQP